jgi:hypothetical protein
MLLVVRAVVLFRPLRVFVPLSALLLTIGAIKLAHDFFRGILSETAVMALIASIVVLAIGLLADMMARFERRAS